MAKKYEVVVKSESNSIEVKYKLTNKNLYYKPRLEMMGNLLSQTLGGTPGIKDLSGSFMTNPPHHP